MLKRVDFSHIKTLYGDPICCSNNGKVLVFRMRGTHLQYMHTQAESTAAEVSNAALVEPGSATALKRFNDLSKHKSVKGIEIARDKAMVFSLIEMTPTGLSFMRNVNVY